MLAFYGLCILSLIAVTVWGLDRRSKTISANATSTAVVIATEQAKVTATAVARRAEQAKYQMIERFDNNRKSWRAGPEDNKYWSGNITIQNGVYDWNVKDSKDGFVSFAEFSPSYQFHDFDAYVDTKIVEGMPGGVCSGMIFRDTYDEESDENIYYYYSLCNDSTIEISYHTEENDWENIFSTLCYTYPKKWNRLEISVRGSHFIFLINGDVVYEMNDNRQKTGGVSLVIEASEGATAHILFDNFGFQPR